MEEHRRAYDGTVEQQLLCKHKSSCVCGVFCALVIFCVYFVILAVYECASNATTVLIALKISTNTTNIYVVTKSHTTLKKTIGAFPGLPLPSFIP